MIMESSAGLTRSHRHFEKGNIVRIQVTLAACAAALLLAACGGGGASSTPAVPGATGGSTVPGGNPVGQQSSQEDAINAANSLGNPMKNVQEFNNTLSPFALARQVQSASGTCNNGFEFFSPDKNGDPNSTEAIFFYDAACTKIARDAVRKFNNPNGSGNETVFRTVTGYANGNATPISVRTDTVNLSNSTYDQNGYPSIAAGFDRTSTGELDLAGSKTIASDFEFVMSPQTGGNTNNFCGDSAGFNATGIQSLGETFGWSGGTSGTGTRVVNADGSVTWTATHTGSSFKGAIGSLSIAIGTQNTSCPIATPMFTLAGGTQGGQYSIPATTQYLHGELIDLTVTNAQLASGNTLNVTTNTQLQPTDSNFINGIVSNGGTQIATFDVNTFGDGTLTMTSNGKQFVMNDWHVTKG